MHFVKHAAVTAFVDGVKNIRMAQAYLLMSVYDLPARRWEGGGSWFYGGLTCRLVWLLSFLCLFYAHLDRDVDDIRMKLG